MAKEKKVKVEKKVEEKVEETKPDHCLTCGGSGFVESEVLCPDCKKEDK